MKWLPHVFDWPLRVKMVLLLVIASLFPLGIATYINIREARARMLSNTSDLLAARGDQLSDQLDVFNRGYQLSTDRIAHLPRVLDFYQAQPDEVERLKALARSVLNVWPASDENIRGVAILDTTGKVALAAEDALMGLDLSYHKHVKEALRGVPVISDIYLAESEVGNAPTIAYLAPVFAADGKLIGVAAIWVRASALWNVMKASNELAGPGSFAVLFDRLGIRIGHTYSDDMIFHPGGTIDPATVDALVAEQRFGGNTRKLLEDVREFPEQFDRSLAASPDEEMFHGFAPVNQKWNYGVARRFETVPWTIFYMVPEESLNAQIAAMTQQKMLFAGVIMLFALIAGALFALVILKPIRSLSSATKLIADGDLSARVPAGSADELGQLATSFNSMAGQIEEQATALQSTNEDLERRVEERTAEVLKVNESLRRSEKQLSEVFGNAPVAVLVHRWSDRTFVDVNAAFTTLTGWTHDEVIGHTTTEFNIVSEEATARLRSKLSTEHVLTDMEVEINTRNGDIRYVIMGTVFVDIQNERHAITTFVDITERKKAEEAAGRMTRLYEALSQVNQAIVWTQSRDELFAKICEVLVEFGGFHLAWIGLIDSDGKKIQRVSHWGEGMDMLSDAMIDIDLHSESQRPILTAIREGRSYICNDLANDPHTGPWREVAESAGCRALAVLPIKKDDIICGAIKVYSDIAGVFQDKEVALLEEAATDVSFALDNFEREEQRAASDDALLAAQARLASTLAAGSIGTWTWDIVNDNLTGDEFIAHMFSLETDAAAKGLPVSEYLKAVFEEDQPPVAAALEKAIKSCGHYDIEYRVRQKDGTFCWLQAKGRVECDGAGNALSFHGAVMDITERKQAENERRAISEIIQGIVTTPNLDEFLKLVHHSIGQIIYAENCFVMLHEPISDMNYFEFWADKHDPMPAPRPMGTGFSSYVLSTGKPLLLTKESTATLLAEGKAELIGTASPSWVGVPLRTTSRTIGVMVLQHYENENAYSQRDLEFLSSVGDQIALAIERKWAETALTESEESYRDLVENALDIIYTHDLNGNYLSINQVGEKITGYTREEVLKMNLADSVAPEYLDIARKMIAEKLAGNQITAYEVEIIAKNGRRVTVEVNTRIIYENGVPVRVQGIARDITDRKQLEEQFRQAQKMEAVGQLAGGVAHDFNNLLTAINGYSDLTLNKMSVGDPLRLYIEEIKNAGERAAGLTTQLLAFSRKQLLVPIVHNLNSVITNIEKMLRRIVRESIEFRISLDPELGNIKADAGQIEQVIMNLVINARDAMPHGGTITIETQNIYLDKDYVSQHLSITPGPFVKIAVTDTGEGMDPETRRQIFEPFFTTKGVGKGTGLGLSTVYGIVKQSGGDIMVYSEIGHGTTFKIYLPCVDESVQKVKWTGDHTDYSGTETILLVEDEEIVRNLAREILTGNGYQVLEADSGKAALLICETYSQPIHLLLTDVIMPGISGPAMKVQIVKLFPEIKVLFMSGYTDDSISNKGILDSGIAFIEKPFSPDALSRKVREVLEY